MPERGGSDIERLWNWISRWTQTRLKMVSFKFRVVLCRIRPSPTLISKIKWLWSELPLKYHMSILKKYGTSPNTCIYMYFKHRSSPKLKMFVVLTADKGLELILDSFRSHMHPILHICLLKFWTKNLHLWGFSLIFGLLWYYYGHLRLIPFWLCTTTILHVLAFMNMREYVLQKRSLFEESFKLFLYIILNSD